MKYGYRHGDACMSKLSNILYHRLVSVWFLALLARVGCITGRANGRSQSCSAVHPEYAA